MTTPKDYRRLWKDVVGTSDGGKAVQILTEILTDKEGRNVISNLVREDAELCIEILDYCVAEHDLKPTEKQAFFVTLRRLVGTHGRLPGSMMITEEIQNLSEILASGGFADVRTGTYKGHLVAVKTMRVTAQDDFLKIRKQFCREIVLWNTLSHPNILKLIGVQGDMEKGRFTTVSEWMEHGNIMEYIKKVSVNRLELLHGTVEGLKYLHSASLVHGDLKGTNILMSNDKPPRACLADFGFMTVVQNPSQPMSCSAQLEGGTIMFMSPELLVPSRFKLNDSLPTPEADIYAFGLVIYQVLTGEVPFRGLRLTELPINVFDGMRPPKPENASAIGLSDPLWNFVQRCWDGKMELRPKVAEAVTHLERAAAAWDVVMPPHVQVKDVSSVSKESISGSVAGCGLFGSSSGTAPESTIESQATSRSSNTLSTSSTQYTALPSPQEVVSKPSNEPQSEPLARTPPRKEEPQEVAAKPSDEPQCEQQTHKSPQKEPYDDLPAVYPHLEEYYKPPLSQFFPNERIGFRRWLHGLFRWS